MWITADLFYFIWFFFISLPHFWVWCIIRKETLLKSVTGSSSVTVDPSRVTQISWNPRFYFVIIVVFILCVWLFSSIIVDMGFVVHLCFIGLFCTKVFWLMRSLIISLLWSAYISFSCMVLMLEDIDMYQWNFSIYDYPCVIQKTLFSIWEFTLMGLLVNGVYLVGFVWVG